MSPPTGVKVVADLAIYGGTVSVMVGGFFLFYLHSREGIVLEILAVSSGTAAIVLGFGLRRLRNWARLGMMVLLGLSVGGNIVAGFATRAVAAHSQTLLVVFWSGIDVLILWYLSRRDIREMFRA